MKQKVDPVITSRVQAPQGVLDPKCAVSKWEILRRGIERKPNPLPTVRGSYQFVLDDIVVVVPQKSPMPGRSVRKDRDGRQNDSENQHATARGKNAPGDFVHTLAADDRDREDKAPASRRTPTPRALASPRFTRNFERHLQLQRSVSHPNRSFRGTQNRHYRNLR